MDNLLSIFLFTIVMTITPGPNNIMILSSGLNFGIKRSLPHLLGIAFGFPIMLIAVGFGLDVLVGQIPITHTVIKVLGVGYLLFLSYKLFTTTKSGDISGNAKPLTFVQVVLFQWVNPKAWVMIFSGIGSFATGVDIQSTTFIIALSFFIAIFPCNGSWLFLGSQMQKIVKSETHFRWFNRTMAVLLIASVVPVML
jgi:threonine/homoserine/homoserine lactone efflux protein